MTPGEPNLPALEAESLPTEEPRPESGLTATELDKITDATFTERWQILSETPQAREGAGALVRQAIGQVIGAHEVGSWGLHGIPLDAAEGGYYAVAKLFPKVDLLPDLSLGDLLSKTVGMEAMTGGGMPSLSVNMARQFAIDSNKGRLGMAKDAFLYAATGNPDHYLNLVRDRSKLNAAAGEFVEVDGRTVEVAGSAEIYRNRRLLTQKLQDKEDATFGDKLRGVGLRLQNWGREKFTDNTLILTKTGVGLAAAGFGIFAATEAIQLAQSGSETLKEGAGALKSMADLGAVHWKSVFNFEALSHLGQSLDTAFSTYSQNLRSELAQAVEPFGETVTNFAGTVLGAAASIKLGTALRAKLRQNSTLAPKLGELIEAVGKRLPESKK